MSNAPTQNGARLEQQDAGLGVVDKDRAAQPPKSRYLPPHLRGKPGAASDDRPPTEPGTDDYEKGGRSSEYKTVKYQFFICNKKVSISIFVREIKV